LPNSADKVGMKNQNSVFVAFALSLTAALMFVYSAFVGYFNGHAVYEAQIDHLQENLEREKLRASLLTYQIKDFQQTVAQVLPAEKSLKNQYALKNLSQVVRSPASDEKLNLSGALFERGKSQFNERKYQQAVASFSQLLEKYPLSSHVVEARFFIAESFFLQKDYRSSLEMIDQMVTLYPQHDLTGFILLRMGQISEINNQSREAAEIYKTVQSNFSNVDLQKQARGLASHVEK
jgi:TolA-binding protein